MNHAENYMHTKIEEMYPEICKAIQHRRAQYYLLVHEYHYVEKMMKNGQIEDKEASQLKSEIDYKIFNLQLHPPEIILADQSDGIIYYSELSEVFERDELRDAIKNEKFEEKIFNRQDQILEKDIHVCDKILYVARGYVVEKDGAYLDHGPQMKYKRYNIACLQNLLPYSENEKQISDVYCNAQMASIAFLSLDKLRGILLKDLKGDCTKMTKFWQKLAPRMIIIQIEQLPHFASLTQDKVQLFCKMCQIQIYKPGEDIDVRQGGVLLRGSITRLSKEAMQAKQDI